MLEVKVGADPEFFLFDTVKKMHVSAHDLVPGTKYSPHKLIKGALQADGTAVEFNIDAASTEEEFVDNIATVLGQIRNFVPGDKEFKFIPCVTYEKKYFESLPDMPKILGCDPDYNIHTKKPSPMAKNAESSPFRAAGGHIHIGWTSGKSANDPFHVFDCEQVAQVFECLILPVSYFWDRDTERRSIYGARGSTRIKPYGVEYRTLSSAWLNHPKLWPVLFRAAANAVKICEEGKAGRFSYTYLFDEMMNVEKNCRAYSVYNEITGRYNYISTKEQIFEYNYNYLINYVRNISIPEVVKIFPSKEELKGMYLG